MNSGTLPTLVAISRTRPAERRLCCPDCGGDIELRGGRYQCLGMPFDECRSAPFRTLTELAVRGAENG